MSNSLLDRVTFNRGHLAVLEKQFGTKEQLANAVTPGCDKEELLLKAGQQMVLDAVRKSVNGL